MSRPQDHGSNGSETSPLLLGGGDIGEQHDQEIPTHRDADPMRFWVMAIFVFLVSNQAVFWFTFSSAGTPGVREYYAIDDGTLDMLLNWGPIGGMLGAPFAIWLLSKPRGLQKSMQLASALMLGCCALRLVPCYFSPTARQRASAHSWLHTGQFLNALSGPLVMGTCSMLSAVWFPPECRSTATAVAYCGGSMGGALGFAFGPLILKNSAGNTKLLLQVEAAMALVPFLACFFCLPAAPCRGSASAAVLVPKEATSVNVWFARVGKAARNPTMLALAAIAGVQAGVNSAWGGLIPQTVANPTTASLCGLLNGVLQLGGNVAGGAIADTLFRRRLKAALQLSFVLNAIALVLFALSVPSVFSHQAFLPTSPPVVIMWAALAGFFQGSADPILFELGAELTYGKSAMGAEGISGNLLVLVWNLTSFVMFFLAPMIQAMSINVIAPGAFLLVAIGTAVLIAEKYSRQDTERQLAHSEQRLN
eukprot:m.94350 g.94350  ORF g.94350 m.94350 type:complete len:478 (+) comp12232_c0_seq1:156-1589(+)